MPRQRAAPSTRKRSFLLLEVLVSLALIAICLFPLIRPLAIMRQSDRKYLEDIQLKAASQHAYCKLKKMLYEHEISWKQLFQGTEGTIDETYQIAFSKNQSRLYQCKYKIYNAIHAKKPSKNMVGLAFYVDFTFISGTHNRYFSRTLYVEKHNHAE